VNYIILAGLLLALIAANYFLRFDVDTRQKGEPMRDWKAKATYPKSYLHALQAFALMMVAFALAVHVVPAALIVFAGLLAFEWSQGFLDWQDVIANGVGIVAAVAVLYLAPILR
jgi:hypothetical protein